MCQVGLTGDDKDRVTDVQLAAAGVKHPCRCDKEDPSTLEIVQIMELGDNTMVEESVDELDVPEDDRALRGGHQVE